MATAKKLSRQRRALVVLESTLKSGVKTLKDGTTKVPLTESDKNRIQRESETLRQRLAKG